MLKKIILLSTLFCSTFAYARPIKTDWEKNNLKGQVKQYQLTEYDFSRERAEKTIRIFDFNSKGFLVRETRIPSTPIISSEIIYEYQYDDQNRVIKSNDYAHTYSHTYTTNPDGSEVEHKQSLPDDKGMTVEENTYDSKGFLVRSKRTIKDNLNDRGTTNDISYRYNEKGHLIETYNNEFNFKDFSVNYQFKNNKIQKQESIYFAPDLKIIYQFDENEGLISETTFRDGQLEHDYKVEYKRDEKGNITSMIYRDKKSGEVKQGMVYQYTYY